MLTRSDIRGRSLVVTNFWLRILVLQMATTYLNADVDTEYIAAVVIYGDKASPELPSSSNTSCTIFFKASVGPAHASWPSCTPSSRRDIPLMAKFSNKLKNVSAQPLAATSLLHLSIDFHNPAVL
jgi:hypothetical protein